MCTVIEKESQTKLSKRRLKCDLNKHKKRKLFWIWRQIIICCLVLVVPLIYFVFVINIPLCSAPINYNVIVKSLNAKIYGQSEAISMIQSVLSLDYKLRIMIFVGGTGQGKTLTSRIIADSLKLPEELYLFQGSYKDFINKLTIHKLKSCSNSFIILDDLTFDDIEDSCILLNHILDYNKNIGNLVILLIFNIERLDSEFNAQKNYTSAIETISSHLDQFKQPTFFVKFYDLNTHSLEMCAKDSLQHFSLPQTKENIDKLLKLSNYSNCKQISSKAVLV